MNFGGWVREFDRDQDGTSLTEFAIMLPVFVLILKFIVYMGVFGHYKTEEWNQTQRDLWFEVRADQQLGHVPIDPNDPGQWDTDPERAGTRGLADLAEYPVRPWPESMETTVGNHERNTLTGLQTSGSWGESHQRTRLADDRMDFFPGRTGYHVASSPDSVIGGSRYASDLVNDSSGTRVDYLVNRGLPMVVGASIRYGVAQAVREREINWAPGWEFRIQAEYNVMMPPRPPPNAEVWAQEVARSQLDNHQPYANLLGIANHQPLQGASAPSVPTSW